MIMAKGSNRLKGAINVSGKHVLELKAMSDKASTLEMGSSTETILLKKEYKCAFKKDSNGSLLNKTLVEDGLSLRALLDSGHEGIILLLTVVKLTRFLVKWRLDLKWQKCSGQFVSNENGYAGHYLKMLAEKECIRYHRF
jgi:hypothetical protein